MKYLIIISLLFLACSKKVQDVQIQQEKHYGGLQPDNAKAVGAMPVTAGSIMIFLPPVQVRGVTL